MTLSYRNSMWNCSLYYLVWINNGQLFHCIWNSTQWDNCKYVLYWMLFAFMRMTIFHDTKGSTNLFVINMIKKTWANITFNCRSTLVFHMHRHFVFRWVKDFCMIDGLLKCGSIIILAKSPHCCKIEI